MDECAKCVEGPVHDRRQCPNRAWIKINCYHTRVSRNGKCMQCGKTGLETTFAPKGGKMSLATDIDLGPGGFCDECGHFACRHLSTYCRFATTRTGTGQCECSGMTWNGKKYLMSSEGPVSEIT